MAKVGVQVWFFKGLYLIATGLFRADDAHPGQIVAFGGAVSVTIINTMTLIRLKKQPRWAFRRGPIQPAPISPATAR